MKTLKPEEQVHPLRLELDDDQLGEIAQGVAEDAHWMTLEELAAVEDVLYDAIASSRQTHPGTATLQ